MIGRPFCNARLEASWGARTQSIGMHKKRLPGRIDKKITSALVARGQFQILMLGGCSTISLTGLMLKSGEFGTICLVERRPTIDLAFKELKAWSIQKIFRDLCDWAGRFCHLTFEYNLTQWRRLSSCSVG